MNRQKEFYYYAEQVTKRTGVGLRKMQSQDRHREVAEARQCLMYLLKFKMKLTLMDKQANLHLKGYDFYREALLTKQAELVSVLRLS